jgi:hypothetical protein
MDWPSNGCPTGTRLCTRRFREHWKSRSSFRYVRVYQNLSNKGLHLASETPILARSADEMVQRMPEAAARDLVEWDSVPSNAEADLAAILGHEISLSRLTEQDLEAPALQDDYPVNEYFALRRGTSVGREARFGSE